LAELATQTHPFNKLNKWVGSAIKSNQQVSEPAKPSQSFNYTSVLPPGGHQDTQHNGIKHNDTQN